MKLHGIFNNTHKTLLQRRRWRSDMAPAIAGANRKRESAYGSKMDANGKTEGRKND